VEWRERACVCVCIGRGGRGFAVVFCRIVHVGVVGLACVMCRLISDS
jgi:hypothetical protein